MAKTFFKTRIYYYIFFRNCSYFQLLPLFWSYTDFNISDSSGPILPAKHLAADKTDLHTFICDWRCGIRQVMKQRLKESLGIT